LNHGKKNEITGTRVTAEFYTGFIKKGQKGEGVFLDSGSNSVKSWTEQLASYCTK
jgi:hypothetical protein